MLQGKRRVLCSLVIPSVMMSVILQQEDSILMLNWSTTSTWKEENQPLRAAQLPPPFSHWLPVGGYSLGPAGEPGHTLPSLPDLSF